LPAHNLCQKIAQAIPREHHPSVSNRARTDNVASGKHGSHCDQRRNPLFRSRGKSKEKTARTARLSFLRTCLWSASVVETLPAFDLVFTLSHELNGLILTNKRILLSHLFKAVSETLVDFGHTRLGGQIRTPNRGGKGKESGSSCDPRLSISGRTTDKPLMTVGWPLTRIVGNSGTTAQ